MEELHSNLGRGSGQDGVRTPARGSGACTKPRKWPKQERCNNPGSVLRQGQLPHPLPPGGAALGAVESGARLGGPDGGRRSWAFFPRATKVKCVGAERGPSCPQPGRPLVRPFPKHPAHLSPPPPPPDEGSPANEEVSGGGRKPSRAQCLRQGCPILTQEDALTAAKRSPPARYLRFQNPRNFQRSRCPEPPISSQFFWVQRQRLPGRG